MAANVRFDPRLAIAIFFHAIAAINCVATMTFRSSTKVALATAAGLAAGCSSACVAGHSDTKNIWAREIVLGEFRDSMINVCGVTDRDIEVDLGQACLFKANTSWPCKSLQVRYCGA